MADASHLHEDDDNGHPHHVQVSISPQNNHLPHHLDEFDVYPLDLDFSSSQDFFHRRTRRFDPIPPPISSLDRENQVNFVIDMFHQRVEHDDINFRVMEENDVISNEFEVDFGAGLGFLLENRDNPNCDDDDDGSGDDFFVPSRIRNRHGARSDSGDSCQSSGTPEIHTCGLSVTDLGSDSDEAEENEIIEVVDGDCDEEASFQLCWDSFQLEDETRSVNPNPNPNSNPNANEDFEWEEVDDQTEERETLSMFFGAELDEDESVLPVILTGFEEPIEEHEHEHEHDLDHDHEHEHEHEHEHDHEHEHEHEHEDDALEWQVLSNVHNFDPNPDSEDQYDDYNYTEYEMFFGHFADSDVSSSTRPPASKLVVDNLSTVLMTQEDAIKNNTLCAVCKDEVIVGEMATQLPCSHRFHGDCILPWLAIRNTCPVCRHELLTDDLDYERRKAERAGLA